MSKFLLNLLLQISKDLVNSKIHFPYFRPSRPCGPLGLWPSQPSGLAATAGRNRPGRPTYPTRRSRLHGNTFSLLVRAFRAGRLSLVSLSSGPRLSAPSPTSSRPSSPAPPLLPGHRAQPSSAPRVPSSRYHLAFILPPLIPLLNPPPSSMVLKSLTSALTPPATPPRRSPNPYKRRAPPLEFTAPLPASLRFSPRSSLPLTERHRLWFCTAIAWPPCHCSSTDEAPAELPVLSSLYCPPPVSFRAQERPEAVLR
jgi:hypothetical protein